MYKLVPVEQQSAYQNQQGPTALYLRERDRISALQAAIPNSPYPFVDIASADTMLAYYAPYKDNVNTYPTIQGAIWTEASKYFSFQRNIQT